MSRVSSQFLPCVYLSVSCLHRSCTPVFNGHAAALSLCPLSSLLCLMQIDGLVGAKEVLRTVPEKTAFLLSLHAKDRLRLLGMVCLLLSCHQGLAAQMQ